MVTMNVAWHLSDCLFLVVVVCMSLNLDWSRRTECTGNSSCVQPLSHRKWPLWIEHLVWLLGWLLLINLDDILLAIDKLFGSRSVELCRTLVARWYWRDYCHIKQRFSSVTIKAYSWRKLCRVASKWMSMQADLVLLTGILCCTRARSLIPLTRIISFAGLSILIHSCRSHYSLAHFQYATLVSHSSRYRPLLAAFILSSAVRMKANFMSRQ